MSEENPGFWERATKQPFVEWFPTKIVVITLVGFAIAFAYGPLGLPLKSEKTQVGFRGTGMVELTERSAYKAVLASVEAIPESDEPIEFVEGDPLARDVYENVPVLGHLSADNFNRVMAAITEWVSPDQGCAYCHGEDGNFASDALYTKVVSRRMIQMTQTVNSQWQDHVKATGVTCYTCHRGQNVPGAIWFDETPVQAGMLGWRNGQNVSSPRVASASLPSGGFEKYLVGDANIRVISGQTNSDATGMNIKDAEHTFGLMIHMSTSLGVNCANCHNTRSMNVWEQGPPQRTTAWYGIRMVRELNNAYLNPLQPVYPPHRLGPTGDAPKANCATCHRGVNKPLMGTPMLVNYPELAAPAPEQQALAN